MFLALETCLSIIAVALAYICPRLGDSTWLSYAEQRFAHFAENRALTAVSVGLLALAIRLILLPILPIPVPETHDEFSYLLLADTLAHGRLANPTHPMWVHLETFHVNWHPTYASMYYPGQGLFLAFGQVVLGHPFWGVWLSAGLMCAAICWALQGWLPPAWALLGGLLAVARLGTVTDWVDNYWGGAIPALGGALAFGALPRLIEAGLVRDALMMGVGMALLAVTRPYEGLFFCVPLISVLFFSSVRQKKPPLRQALSRILPWAAGVLVCALAALGYYFWRVTGSPFTIPYQLNMRTYGLVFFPWSRIVPINYHHMIMERFYRGGAVLGTYHFARQHPLVLQFYKALVVWLFFFGPLLSMPLILWLFSRPRGQFWKSFRREHRVTLIICFVAYISLMLTIYVGQPQYAAPLTAAFYVLVLMALRDLWNWRIGTEPSGRFLVRSVAAICFLLFVARVAAPALHIAPQPSWVRTWCSQDRQNLERARFLKRLQEIPGTHLVIVRYKPEHDFILDEWVFNNADIDGSKVVWARDMGAEKNRELLEYFSQRQVWLVQPDFKPVMLTPYPRSQ